MTKHLSYYIYKSGLIERDDWMRESGFIDTPIETPVIQKSKYEGATIKAMNLPKSISIQSTVTILLVFDLLL